MTAPRDPYILGVSITPADDEHGGFTVRPTWATREGTLDRTDGLGFRVRTLALGERLERAILAGAVFPEPEVATDVKGHTYVSARATVMAKYMNADLTRLGY